MQSAAARVEPALLSMPATRPGTADAAASFEAVYHETVQTVYRYVLMLLRSEPEAEDVTAEAYLRAWRRRESFSGRGTPLSWLMSIARNCAVDAIRARRPEITVEAIPDTPDPDWEAASLIGSHDREFLRRSLAELTLEQQQVIVMRFYEELPHDVVARRLGRNATAVRAIQFRALARLRKLLEASRAR